MYGVGKDLHFVMKSLCVHVFVFYSCVKQIHINRWRERGYKQRTGRQMGLKDVQHFYQPWMPLLRGLFSKYHCICIRLKKEKCICHMWKLQLGFSGEACWSKDSWCLNDLIIINVIIWSSKHVSWLSSFNVAQKCSFNVA